MSGMTYDGEEPLRERVLRALAGVTDPEMSLGIIDLGLVYAVHVASDGVHVTMTMTSPACPVAEALAEEIEAALRAALPDARPVTVATVWTPPWTPDRMTARARDILGWTR